MLSTINNFFKAHAIICVCLVAFLTFASRAICGEEPVTDAKSLLARASDLMLHYRERDLASERLLESDKACEVLLQGLESSRSIVAQVSARLLGRLGGEKAEKRLFSAIQGPRIIVSTEAESALAEAYAAFSDAELFARLDGKQPDPLRSVVDKAVLLAFYDKYNRSDDPAIPLEIEKRAIKLLSSGSPAVRVAAARFLTLSAGKNTVTNLLQLLRDEKSVEVLTAACEALAKIRPAEGGELVKPFTQHEDRQLSLAACYALFGMGWENAGQGIAYFLEDKLVAVRINALRMIAEARYLEAVPEVAKSYSDRSWKVRLAVVMALGEMNATGAKAVLQELLKDSNSQVRSEAAVTLHRMGVMGIEEGMIRDLASGDTSLRIWSAVALGKIKSGKAVAPLAKAVQDNDLELSCRALEALAAIGSEPAVSEIKKTINTPNEVISALARKLSRLAK